MDFGDWEGVPASAQGRSYARSGHRRRAVGAPAHAENRAGGAGVLRALAIGNGTSSLPRSVPIAPDNAVAATVMHQHS